MMGLFIVEGKNARKIVKMSHFASKNILTILFRISVAVAVKMSYFKMKDFLTTIHLYIKDCLKHLFLLYRSNDQSVVNVRPHVYMGLK